MNTLEAHKLKAIGKILDAVDLSPQARLEGIRRVLNWKTFPVSDIADTSSDPAQQQILETPRRQHCPETND